MEKNYADNIDFNILASCALKKKTGFFLLSHDIFRIIGGSCVIFVNI